jgi:hypothetical protein
MERIYGNIFLRAFKGFEIAPSILNEKCFTSDLKEGLERKLAKQNMEKS